MSRLREFDVLKGLAITAVIIIHTTADGVVNFGTSSYSYFIYLVVNRFSQFAVPTFLFASSVLLSYIYRDDFQIISIENLATFYRKRLMRVIPPYLIWTFIYTLLRHIISRDSILSIPHDYAKYLVTGDGYYHLYFILIILQLYIFLPFMVSFVSHIKLRFRDIFAVAAIIQVIFYYIYHSYIIRYFDRSAVMMAWYFLPILMGVWIGINYETYCKKEQRIVLLIPLIVISGASYTYLYYLSNINMPISSSLFNLSWYSYVTSASLMLLYISKKLNIRFWENSGQLSFGIYLIHPLLLLIMNSIFAAGNIMVYHLYTLAEFIIIYAASYLITAYIGNTSHGRYIIG